MVLWCATFGLERETDAGIALGAAHPRAGRFFGCGNEATRPPSPPLRRGPATAGQAPHGAHCPRWSGATAAAAASADGAARLGPAPDTQQPGSPRLLRVVEFGSRPGTSHQESR